MSSILLVGAGGHARAAIDVIEMAGTFKIAGLVGTPEEAGTSILGYKVIGGDNDLPALLRDHPNALVTVGQIKSPDARMRLFALIKKHGGFTPAIVSPLAHVSRHASIGAGTLVMHMAVVNAGASVGQNCIVNTHALIEHDTVVGDHCHISTSASINSGVRVGDGVFIGSRACVRQGLSIGERSLVGMGERVLADLEAGARLPRKVK